MRAKTAFVALLAGAAWALPAHADDWRDVADVRAAFRAIYPTRAELAIYQLDWAPTLTSAKEKAAREQRPIFLVVVTNSFGDMCSGHC